jgi:Protein of unknown function (DUF4199)
MFATALKYGAASGVIVIAVIVAGIFYAGGPGGGHAFSSMWFGYLVMIIALSMIFLAIREYRNKTLGGVIKFLPAFGMGLFVAAIAAVVYVIAWETFLATTGYPFMENYTARLIEAERSAGTTGAELDAFIAQMERYKADYANPLYRLPMTFIEIFPVGLLIALISAAILRNPKVLPARGQASASLQK